MKCEHKLCFRVKSPLTNLFPLSHAVGISIFHSIAAFNNSGFDILGGLTNLIPFQQSILLNLTTAVLIIFGGLGFLVILEILHQRSFHKLSLHAKVVIVTSIFLTVAGTLLLKVTENISWLGAFSRAYRPERQDFPLILSGSLPMRDCLPFVF